MVTLDFAKPLDKKIIYEMLVSEEVKKFMFDNDHRAPTWEEFNEEPDILFSGEKNEEGNYLLIKNDDEVIGTISYSFNHGRVISAELDIWISSVKNLGKGYGIEAIKRVLDFVHREFGVKIFLIRPWIKNKNAICAYKKCGFREIADFDPLYYYSPEDAELYGEGDYGSDTANLIYEVD